MLPNTTNTKNGVEFHNEIESDVESLELIKFTLLNFFTSFNLLRVIACSWRQQKAQFSDEST